MKPLNRLLAAADHRAAFGRELIIFLLVMALLLLTALACVPDARQETENHREESLRDRSAADPAGVGRRAIRSLIGGPTRNSDALGFVLADSSYFEIWDVATLHTGDAPEFPIKHFNQQYRPLLNDIGTAVEDVATTIVVEDVAQMESLWIIQGDLDFDNVRNRLRDLDHTKKEYRGYEVWTGGNGDFFEVALIGDDEYVLLGMTPTAVQDVLRAFSSGRNLLANAEGHELDRAIANAGNGWHVVGYNDCSGTFPGCIVGAESYSGLERDSAYARAALLFQNERAARDILDEVEAYAEEKGLLGWWLDSDVENIEAKGDLVIVETIARFETADIAATIDAAVAAGPTAAQQASSTCDFDHTAPGRRPGDSVLATVEEVTPDHAIVVSHFASTPRHPTTTLRLWGIANPDSQTIGYAESLNFLKNTAVPGEQIRFYQLGVLPDGSQQVTVQARDIFINQEMLRRGHALKLTTPAEGVADDCFSNALAEAQNQRIGIWEYLSPEDFQHRTNVVPSR